MRRPIPDLTEALWVITSYFNPARYKIRRDNYRAFHNCLGAPLLTVELSPAGDHELTKEDGDIVVSLVGENRIWQKERLLNIALAALPPHVEYVAWVDCDIIFEDAAWAKRAQHVLSHGGGLLHLFDRAVHLPQNVALRDLSPNSCAQYTPVGEDASIVSAFSASEPLTGERLQGDRLGQYRIAKQPIATGMAWAARRATVTASGFYDRNILGGGDSVQTFAAMDRLDNYFTFRRLTPAHQNDIRLWAKRAEFAGLFSKLNALNAKIYHLWHGTLESRDYRGRYDILRRNHFDPAHDIRHASNGTWMWSDPQSALAQEVGAYFFSRCEDDIVGV